MKRLCDECFVLDTFALGEADLIVTLWAREEGKVRAVAPAARRSLRRFGGALEPLTRIRAEWSEKQGRELHRLESADCVRSFATMQREPELQATCAVLREIALTFGHEGQAEPSGFRLLAAVLEALEAGADPATSLRYYEYWMLRLHGLLPDLEACSLCGAELSAAGATRLVVGHGLRCRACRPAAGARELAWGAADGETLAALARRAPGQIAALPRAARGGAVEALLRGALEGFAERRFRSYRHLELSRATGAGGSA